MKKRVVVAVSGGIAAYKACDVVRRLQDAGCDVRVCMTENACSFVGPITFEALSHHPVLTDLFAYPESPNPHIMFASWADACVCVPATADIMAKVAGGIADDCVTTTILALHAPVLFAPAMNVHMWQDSATQKNVQALESMGYAIIRPESGLLACGDVGEGKLAAVPDIVSAVMGVLDIKRDLAGTRILVNAGPTHEAIDSVRYIANSSSGKMGFALAEAAADRGAEVVLVAGPVSLPTPDGVERIDVVSAHDMFEACTDAFEGCDAAICAAAVADYTPKRVSDHKLKKSVERLEAIELVETADILAELCRVKGERIVCGFAAETNDVIAYAEAKLARKGADMIVANDVSKRESTFGSDTNRITIVAADGNEELPVMSKRDAADAILDRIAARIKARA